VTERFLGHDPPAMTELAEARLAIAIQLQEAKGRLPQLVPGSLLVGLAGTVSTLAALEHGLVDYDRSVLHHSLLERGQVEHWLATLAGEDSKARLARPGMVEGRQDVIVGGVLVLSSVMENFGCRQCLVSEDDILDGLAASLRYS
jgi:exopolyphosphatase/guanosine-5'-triphosphate,3'-diphosphate pyrophosphatase